MKRGFYWKTLFPCQFFITLVVAETLAVMDIWLKIPLINFISIAFSLYAFWIILWDWRKRKRN